MLRYVLKYSPFCQAKSTKITPWPELFIPFNPVCALHEFLFLHLLKPVFSV